jgi:hypothetical protein
MLQSFACDVDIEDLGVNSLSPDRLAPISFNDLTPAALKHQHPRQQQQQWKACFSKALKQLQPGSILAPSSMQQLLQGRLALVATKPLVQWWLCDSKEDVPVWQMCTVKPWVHVYTCLIRSAARLLQWYYLNS